MGYSSLGIFTRKLVDSVLEWIEVLVMAVFIGILIFGIFFKLVNVDGDSMNMTLYNTDKLIVSDLFYTPENGDIVVLYSQILKKHIVKRVIATEGQTVEIDYNNQTLTVDGIKIDESDYLKEKIMYDDRKNFLQAHYNVQTGTYQYTVPKGCLFVLGDNRNHSTDSRELGFVSTDDIIGKVIFRIFSPYGKAGLI